MSRAPLTLRQAARQFLRYPSPRLILATAAGALVARVAVGGISPWDLAIPAVMVALQPFVEWVIHVVLLHWRPRTVLGLRLDPHVAREHRRHHADPNRVDLVFIPFRTLVLSLSAVVAGWLLLAPSPSLALTGILSQALIALVYEWIHYLTHMPYRPRGRWYRARLLHHRLHHFKNERYWYGVTLHLGDRVLGTLPPAQQVEVSPTARDLDARA